jgi:hypothetical protein
MRILAWVVVCVVGCAPQKSTSPSSGTNGGSTGASVTSTGMTGGNGGNGGNVGSTGSTGSTTGGSACTPFSTWCDGNMLMNCTRSGMDATGFDCTKLSSTMLTYACVDQCPNSSPTYGPCCSYTTTGSTGSTGGTTGSPAKPTCVAAITAPTAVSGDNTTFTNGVSCSAPSAPDCPGLGYGAADFHNEPKTCPPSGWYMSIDWDRAKVKLNVPTTPGNGFNIDYTDVGNDNNDCDTWSGSATLVSDTPTWKVTFDVTCTSGPSVHLAGTLSGTVSP